VGGGQPHGDLTAKAQHLGQGELFFAFQPLFQGLALQELHGQIRNAAVLANLEDGDDVFVVDARTRLGLAQEAPACGSARQHSRPHDLQGHETRELKVFGLKDHTHAPNTEDLQDAIRTETADFTRSLRRRQEIVDFLGAVGRGQSRRHLPNLLVC
jgi:hypothetical protein